MKKEKRGKAEAGKLLFLGIAIAVFLLLCLASADFNSSEEESKNQEKEKIIQEEENLSEIINEEENPEIINETINTSENVPEPVEIQENHEENLNFTAFPEEETFNAFDAGSNIGIEWAYPTSSINATQTSFFNISVNVSCWNANCGEINVTLDPIQGAGYSISGLNYTMYNSSETGAENYTWEEIVTNGDGTILTFSSYDDSYATLNLPFNFTFYSTNYTTIYVSTNARIHFTDTSAGNWDLALASSTVKCISMANRDLRIYTDGVYYSNKTNPNRIVITYQNISDYGASAVKYTFQTILYADGKMKVQYRNTSTAYSAYNNNGLNWNLTANLLIGTDAPDQYKGMAVTFYPPGYTSGSSSAKGGVISMNSSATPFYTNITNPYNLTLNQGESQIITWYINATGTTPNTPYEFFIYANETTNLTIGNQTSRINITIRDTAPPIINLAYPLNTTYNINVSNVNYSYSDYSGSGTCWYSNTSGGNSTTNSSGNNFTRVITSEGTNTFVVYCNDSSGNLANSSFITFFKDTAFPIFSNYGGNNATMNGSGIAVFNATILNTNGTVLLYINGTNYTANNISANTWNYSLFLVNGTYSYNWISWGNGSLTNYNLSNIGSYTLYSNMRIISVNASNSSGSIGGAVLQGTNVTINVSVENAANILLKIWQTFIGGNSIWQGLMSFISGNLWSKQVTTNVSFNVGQVNYSIYANDSLRYQISVNGTFNVTDTTAPSVYLRTPANATLTRNATQWFSANCTDNVMLTNSTLFIWNSSNSIINQTTINITNAANFTNISVTLPYDNIFKWNYYSCDYLSNCAFNNTNWTITYDSTPPSINITYPLNTSYNINVRAINYTYSDANGNGTCWYSNSSGAWNSTIPSSGANFTNVNSTEGSNTWTVYCNDTAGNLNFTSITFSKATSRIGIQLVSPAGNMNASQNQMFQVSVNVSCSNSNCGEINVTLDPSGTVYTFTTCGKTGRNGPNQTQCNSAYSGTSLSGAVIVGSGIQNWTVPATGTYTIEVYGAGNGTQSSQKGAYIKGDFTLIKDAVLKILVGQLGTNSYCGSGGTFVTYGNNTPIIVAGGAGGGTGNSIRLAGNISTSGSPDSSGAYAGGTNGNGGTAPTSSCYAQSGAGLLGNGGGCDDIAAVSFTNGGVGAQGATIYEGGFGGGGTGRNSGRMGGGGGYSGGASTDSTAAGGGGSFNTGTNQNNTAGYNLGSGSVIITSSGGKSGTVSMNTSATPFYTTTQNPYTLSLNAGASQIITWTVNATGATNNTHAFFVYANLTADITLGNQTTQWNVTIVNQTGTSVSITYPSSSAYYNINVSQLNYTVSGSNLSSCWYSLNSGATNSSAYSAGTNFTGISSSEGSNTWTVYCNDSLSIIASSSVTFFKDTISPIFTNISNISAEYGSAVIYILNASDTNGISCYSLNDTSNFNINCSGYLKNSTRNSVGTYWLNITINDTYNNKNYGIIYINISDTIYPLINFTSTVQSNNTYKNQTFIYVNVTVTEINEANITFSLYNLSSLVNITTLPAGNRSINWTSLPDGRYYYNVTDCDNGRNCNSTETRIIVLDTASPNASQSYPENNSYVNNGTINFTASLSDIQGIKNATLNVYNSTNSLVNQTSSNYSENILETILGIPVTLVQGAYKWLVSIFDRAGNFFYTQNRTLTIDLTYPNVTLNSPLSNYANSSALIINITFNCSSADNYLLKNLSLYITDRQNSNFRLNQTSIISGTLNSSVWTLALVSGNYTWGCFVYDYAGNLNYSSNRTILLNLTDSDNDWIPDTSDNLHGNESSVNATGIARLNITISENSTQGTYNQTQQVIFTDSGAKIINFTHNFSSSSLDLSRITIIKSENSIIVNLSSQIQADYNKTLYISDNSFISLCVKDSEISSISQISENCNNTSEYDFTSCLSANKTLSSISCIDEGAIIRIENLRHSAIRGTQAVSQESVQQSGSSGGGGSAVCQTNWTCSSWSFCSQNLTQTRACRKADPQCVVVEPKPKEFRECPNILFDVLLDIKPQTIAAADKLRFYINLKEINTSDLIDIQVKYRIVDLNDKVVHEETETIAVSGRKEYVKEIPNPELPLGKYSAQVIVYYGKEQTASSFHPLEIVEKKTSTASMIIIILIIIASILLGFFLYNQYRIRKDEDAIKGYLEKIDWKKTQEQKTDKYYTPVFKQGNIFEKNEEESKNQEKEKIELSEIDKDTLTLLNKVPKDSAVTYVKANTSYSEYDIAKSIEKLSSLGLIETIKNREGEIETDWLYRTSKVKDEMLNDNLRFKKDMGWDF